jgi:flagellar biosynthetic protein FliP
LLGAGLWLGAAGLAEAQGLAQPLPGTTGGDGASYARLLLLFAAVSLAPALLAVLTAFCRICVVLLFLRAGLGSNQIPPTPVLIGLSVLLTVVAMAGPLQGVNEQALQPWLQGAITPQVAAQRAEGPLRDYLSARVRPEDLQAVRGASGGTATPAPAFPALAAAYVLSELRAAFLIGFVVVLPFLVIDLVVGGTLATLGLTTLPHTALALPFKLLLFVMVDGWRLLTVALLGGLQV